MRHPLSGALAGSAVLAALTGLLAPLLDERQLFDVAMLYLLVVLVTAAIWGYAAGLWCALLADLLLNFFFVEPLHTFTVHEPRNLAALGIFLVVAALGGFMLSLLRRQLALANARRAELAVMLSLSRAVAGASTPRWALDALCDAVRRALAASACAILQHAGGRWSVVATTGAVRDLPREDAALAGEALASGGMVRRGGSAGAGIRLPTVVRPGGGSGGDVFVPFTTAGREPGVLRVTGPIRTPAVSDLDALLHAFADEAAVALHRARLADEAQRAEALERADEFKSVLLSSVSHDLRSPLTAIKASVDSLRSDDVAWSDEDRDAFLATIASQTERLTSTVTNLLEMSRLEGGAVRPRPEPVEVGPLLAEAANATRELTHDRRVEVDAGAGGWVRADYGLALQALVNLVENAAKYSTPGQPISLRASRANGTIAIDVADSGPGIAPDDLPHIFEKFYRGASRSRASGTGLGLAIVKAMVELCGGSVGVRSAPDGTVFTVQLPLSPGPAR
jgi:two-component system sensor histidine kinase KdpD